MKTGQHWQDIFQVVIQETDFILEILDARNPIGTQNRMIEKFVQNTRPEIKFFLVINKSDIIPKSVLEKWIEYFNKQNYNVYHVSAKYNRGISYLFRDLRRIVTRPHSNVLIVGYPNTGKSTLIEALTKNKKKVGTSSKAGFTRNIQKVKLTKKIYLIDTPGVIPIDETNETELAIKACMVADKLEDPLRVVEAIFQLVEIEQFETQYDIKITSTDTMDEIITKIGKKFGRLVAGGRVNKPEVYKMIIRDWQANKLHYYQLPPDINKIKTGDTTNQKLKAHKKKKHSKGLIPPSLGFEKKEQINSRK